MGEKGEKKIEVSEIISLINSIKNLTKTIKKVGEDRKLTKEELAQLLEVSLELILNILKLLGLQEGIAKVLVKKIELFTRQV